MRRHRGQQPLEQVDDVRVRDQVEVIDDQHQRRVPLVEHVQQAVEARQWPVCGHLFHGLGEPLEEGVRVAVGGDGAVPRDVDRGAPCPLRHRGGLAASGGADDHGEADGQHVVEAAQQPGPQDAFGGRDGRPGVKVGPRRARCRLGGVGAGHCLRFRCPRHRPVPPPTERRGTRSRAPESKQFARDCPYRRKRSPDRPWKWPTWAMCPGR